MDDVPWAIKGLGAKHKVRPNKGAAGSGHSKSSFVNWPQGPGKLHTSSLGQHLPLSNITGTTAHPLPTHRKHQLQLADWPAQVQTVITHCPAVAASYYLFSSATPEL